MEQIKALIIEILGNRSIGDTKLITTVMYQIEGATEAQTKEAIAELIASGEVLRAGGNKRKFLNLNAKRRTPLAVAVERYVTEHRTVTRDDLNVFVEAFMTEHALFNPMKKPLRQVWGAMLGLLRDKTFVKNIVDGVETISVATIEVAENMDAYLEPLVTDVPVSDAVGVETVVMPPEPDAGFIAA